MFHPAFIKGITVYPDNPLHFDFIVDTGDSGITGDALEQESSKLIKYFLAAMTMPENEMWVNLSPYEKDRIIPEQFSQTEMGRDLLAQDYILKQLSASLIYPEEELGQDFWARVYKKARELYGHVQIPLNTFNKVWIVPEKAVVYEHEGGAFIVESRLKVMLEQDYVTLNNNLENKDLKTEQLGTQDVSDISKVISDIVREVLLPEIEKEVNEGKNFANLRQIYHSMILATWYKQALRESLLGQVYANKKKIKGVDVEDKEIKEKIYEQYLEAFKKGVYNYIREDLDPGTNQKMPRKYFSGGAGFETLPAKMEVVKGDLNSSSVGVRARVVQGFRQSSPISEIQKVEVDLVENVEDEEALEQRMSSPITWPWSEAWYLKRLDSPDPEVQGKAIRYFENNGDINRLAEELKSPDNTIEKQNQIIKVLIKLVGAKRVFAQPALKLLLVNIEILRQNFPNNYAIQTRTRREWKPLDYDQMRNPEIVGTETKTIPIGKKTLEEVGLRDKVEDYGSNSFWIDNLTISYELKPAVNGEELVRFLMSVSLDAGQIRIGSVVLKEGLNSSSPITEETQPLGGIDLNPTMLDLQIKRDETGTPLPLPQQPIPQMKINGFFPVIINVTPIPSLPALFGMADMKEMEISEL